MEKFTKGPWALWGRGDPSQVIASDEGFVAQTVGRNDQANAHLIAAAPELYEALSETVRELELCGYSADPLMDRARAALAKARGEGK